ERTARAQEKSLERNRKSRGGPGANAMKSSVRFLRGGGGRTGRGGRPSSPSLTLQPLRAGSAPAAKAERLSREDLAALYDRIRSVTEALAARLPVEDQVVQTMPDVSPLKWHLAHTSWFFETFVLRGFDPARPPLRDGFHDLFNSYYKGLGEPFPRDRRGL